jgi:dihydropteroate synthase
MFTLNCKGRLLLAESPLVMGILNTSDDSFYEKSRFTQSDELLRQAEKMIRDGADMLDIGGQSSRPGAKLVGITEELGRVVPAIEAIGKNFPEAILSIDTFHAPVASAAVAAGAAMVNDISGGNLDQEMLALVASLQIPYICMHLKGDPQTMQTEANYKDLTAEVLDYFIEKIEACRTAGIRDLILDPGFGFAKTVRHNFELLQNLRIFKMLGCPVMLGLSRKSTIYKTLGVTAEEALNGTTVLNTIGLLQGADILRVHDVREAKEAIRLVAELNQGKETV